MEEPHSAELKEFITNQNTTTQSFLQQIPFRDLIKDKLTKAWNFERFGSPFVEGDYIYWYKNDGLQNQSIIYRKAKGSDVEEIFLDPNTFSADGTSSLAALEFTKCGTKAAYFISHAGSDVRECHVIDTKTKQRIEEPLQHIKFSNITWYKDQGFYYSKYYYEDDATTKLLTARTDSHRIFYHALNTPQSQDVEVFGRQPEQKRRYTTACLSDHDYKYLVISAAQATSGNQLYIKTLNNDTDVATEADVVPLVDIFDNDFDFVECYQDILYLTTNYKAPMTKLLAVDLKKFFELRAMGEDVNHIMKYCEANPEKSFVTEIIPETDAVLQGVSVAGEYFVAQYTRLTLSAPTVFTYTGEKVTDIQLPGPGTAMGFHAKRHETETYYSFTSYISPNSIYKLDLKDFTSTLYFAPKVDIEGGLEGLKSEQILIPSDDGRIVPTIVTYDPTKVDLKSGNNPTQLYAYGGFNVNLLPMFSVSTAVWVKLGGVFVVASLSGDGWNGKKSHQAGTKLNKQNVFDDFINVAKYLIAEKVTNPEKLCIRGGSNGGLLTAATLLQAPTLFKAAVPMVGVLDMLRYDSFTSGAGWASDYGTSSESKEMFEYLLKYSPLHNCKENVTYPAVLITTGADDDRVSPQHSFKFAAELQYRSKNVKEPAAHLDRRKYYSY
eukprot:UN01472